jgi:hypothetical protein
MRDNRPATGPAGAGLELSARSSAPLAVGLAEEGQSMSYGLRWRSRREGRQVLGFSGSRVREMH